MILSNRRFPMSSAFALLVLACPFFGFNVIDWVVTKINFSTTQSTIAAVTIFAYEVVGIIRLWLMFNERDDKGKRLISTYECAFEIHNILVRWCMELVALSSLYRSLSEFKGKESYNLIS